MTTGKLSTQMTEYKERKTMPQFDPNSYESVAERINRLYEIYNDARIITAETTSPADREKGLWVVKAEVYLTDGDQANNLPKATGYAFEKEGQGQAAKYASLEVAETSAIGRALGHALAGFKGDKKATSEEMQKVERAKKVADKQDWILEASKLKTLESLRKLYVKANLNGASDDELKEIRRLADEFGGSGK